MPAAEGVKEDHAVCECRLAYDAGKIRDASDSYSASRLSGTCLAVVGATTLTGISSTTRSIRAFSVCFSMVDGLLVDFLRVSYSEERR